MRVMQGAIAQATPWPINKFKWVDKIRKEKGYSQLKKGRYSEVNRVYHLVFSTKDRRSVFADFRQARLLVKILKQDEFEGFTKTLAYVVMPDHVHWLVRLEKGEIPNAVKRIKSIFSQQINQRVWNAGFYDHVIRADEDLANVARYIVANPLRSGLVNRVGDYPHWDAIWL